MNTPSARRCLSSLPPKLSAVESENFVTRVPDSQPARPTAPRLPAPRLPASRLPPRSGPTLQTGLSEASYNKPPKPTR